MLKGTQDGTRFSLSVRQKHPLPGRSTGGIGDFFVGLRLVLGNWFERYDVFAFDFRSPIFSVPE